MKRVGLRGKSVVGLGVLATLPLIYPVSMRADETKPPTSPPAIPATVTKNGAMASALPPAAPLKDSDAPKKTAQQHLDLAMLEMIAKAPISIDVKDVSLDELVAAIEKASTKPIAPKIIDIRTDEPVMVSLKVEKMALGKVMSAAAALAGCNLYLLPDRFVIGAYSSLTEDEKFLSQRYSRDMSFYSQERSYLFAGEIVKNHHNGDKTRLKLNDLSYGEQEMLQWMSTQLNKKNHREVTAVSGDAEIVITTGADGVTNMLLRSQSTKRSSEWLNVSR